MSDKLIEDKDQGAYFVGYGDTPGVDRRFLFGLAGLGIGAAAGLGGYLAINQRSAGGGDWDMGTQITLRGYLDAEPYPTLRAVDGNGNVQTVILACDTKCGAQQKLEETSLDTDRVQVRGSLIARGRHQMMAVSNDADWIQPDESLQPRPAFDTEDLGTVDLRGEILDSKCWFGAMRPNTGSVHKACAMLCIAGGLPPYFYARDAFGRTRAMMITDPDGGPLVQPILRHVADPVRVAGTLVRIEDLIQLRMDPADLQRL